MAAENKFRVACEEHQVEARSEDAARKLRDSIEQLGACMHFHRVEQLVDGQWLSLALVKANRLFATANGVTVDVTDGQLTVAQHVGNVVVLTADGRGVDLTGWCTHKDVSDAGWVRYEKWEHGVGHRGHGYVHSACRKLLQTG